MKLKIPLFLLLAFGILACTNLEEELREDLTGAQAIAAQDVNALLLSAYRDLRGPF